MTRDEVLAVFREAGALLEGHFILSSGRRSGFFIQKMRVFESPARTETLCRALADKVVARFGKIPMGSALLIQLAVVVFLFGLIAEQIAAQNERR